MTHRLYSREVALVMKIDNAKGRLVSPDVFIASISDVPVDLLDDLFYNMHGVMDLDLNSQEQRIARWLIARAIAFTNYVPPIWC